MIKALVFDFDGVILESSEIKTAAFARIFSGEPPEVQRAMREYHLTNMGLSRERKFEYYFVEVKKIPVPDGAVAAMAAQFADLVLAEILAADFVKGMPDFLQEMGGNYPLYVATGTPTAEMRLITDFRGLSPLFTEIFGTPDTKETIIMNIMSEYNFQSGELLLFGDAESDRVAAMRTGINFIGRIGSGSEAMLETKYKINDFSDSAVIVDIISKIEGNEG